LLAVLSLQSLTRVRRVIGATCLAAVLVSLYGFFQAAGHDWFSWDIRTTRVFSSLANATYLAGFLILVLPVAVAVGWPASKREEPNGSKGRSWSAGALAVMFTAPAGIMLICLYLSVSLAPLIGLLFGVYVAVLLVLFRGGKGLLRRAAPWGIAGLLLVGAVGVLAYRGLPEVQQRRVQMVLRLQDPYGKERQIQRQIALGLFREQPIIGKGYGTFRIHSLERLAPAWYTELGKSSEKMLVPSYAHNEYLQVLAGTGLIGGLIFFGLLVSFYGTASRVALRHPDQGWSRLGTGIVAGGTAFLFQNFFGVTFRQTGVVTFFWLWLAVIAVAAAWLPTSSEEQLAPRLREVRFRPFPSARLAVVGLLLALLSAGVASLTVRTVKTGVTLNRAKTAARAGMFEQAAKLADEVIRLTPQSAIAYYLSAYAWGQLGDYEKSLAANKEALLLLPGNASVYYNLGVTYKELGRLEEAERSYQRAIELMPTSVNHQAAMAELLVEQGKLDRALPYAQEAARLAPSNPECYLLLAQVQLGRGELAEAVDHLEQAARLKPRDATLWQQFAEAALELEKYDRALWACRRGIRLDPNSPRAYNVEGVILFRRGRYAPARESFSRALALDAGYHQARLNLANAYVKLHEYRKAEQQFQRLAKTAPDTPQGKVAAEKLRKVRPAR
jgi:tetratricopeptide (TPR) repeat protein